MAEFLNEYYVVLALIFFLMAGIAAVVFIIIFSKRKSKSFENQLNDVKVEKMSIVIDTQEKRVETYFLFDNENKYEVESLDSFYMRFDNKNVTRLKKWLTKIENSVADYNNTLRTQLVMYHSVKNKRRVYLAELDNYLPEFSRYYLTFKDITSSVKIMQKIDKVEILHDDESFFKQVNSKIYSSDMNANNYIATFRYKEYQYAKKELQPEFIKTLEEKIFLKLEELKFPTDMLCLSEDGTFILFVANSTNEKRLIAHLKEMTSKISGEYDIIKHQFKYSVHMVCGYLPLSKNETFTIDAIMKAKTAADFVIGSGSLSNKVQLFDEKIQSYHNETNNKILSVEIAINEDQFEIEYVPIMEVKDKKVKGYNINVIIPQSLDMDLATFREFAKLRHLRIAFYTKIFENIKKLKFPKKTQFYLTFDFDDIDRVFEVYYSREDFQSINCIFCVEFSNKTLQNYDLIDIEKTLAKSIKGDVKCGIAYNNLTPIYLNAKIYSKTNVTILKDQLIETLLDNHAQASLLNVYVDVAKTYNHDIIGLNVDSIALYETLVHNRVNKVGGKFITSNIDKDKMVDETLLKTLNEIETRPY